MSNLLSNTIANQASTDAVSAARCTAAGVVTTWFGILGIARDAVVVEYNDGTLIAETVISSVWGTVGSQNFSALVTFDARGALVTGVSVAGTPVCDRKSLEVALRGI